VYEADKRWQRVALLDVNPWFEKDVKHGRALLRISESGFSFDEAKAWDEERRSQRAERLRKIPWMNRTEEDNSDPFVEYIKYLIWRYRLPRSFVLNAALQHLILTDDYGFLNYVLSPGAHVVVEVSVEKELTITIEGLNVHITRKDWGALYDTVTSQLEKWEGFLEDNFDHQRYKASPQFQFHKYLYRRVQREGCSEVKAAIEWAEISGDEGAIKVSEQAVSTAIQRLKTLMRPQN